MRLDHKTHHRAISTTVGGAIIVIIIVIIAGIYYASTLSNNSTATISTNSGFTNSTTTSPIVTYSSSMSTSASGTNTSSGGATTIIIPAGVGAHEDSLNFQPASVSVAPGTTVTWVNKDTTSIHNVYFLTMPTGATISPNPSPDTNNWNNNQFSVTLTTPGTYTYECQYHSGWMQGTITVT